MERSPSSLKAQQFDVLVVGAGINGAATAWDLALRGFKTALIDKGDFGNATSAGCFKMVHGGLRYLQHLDIKRLRESVAEQRILRQLAPHLVHPLPVLIPCYQRLMQRKGVLQTALMTYELLSLTRNRGVQESHRLPGFSTLSTEACLSRAPGLKQQGLTGGVMYYDCQMSNCDRLTLEVALSAARAGAVIANYVELLNCETEAAQTGDSDGVERIRRVRMKDLQSGEEFSSEVRAVVNATGPWNEAFGKTLGLEAHVPRLRYSKGIQLVLPQLVSSCALAVESSYGDPAAILARGGRSYFVQPWRGYSLVGTSDEVYEGDPDTFTIGREEIQQLVSELQSAYGSDRINLENVRYSFGGLRPLDPKAVEQMHTNGADSDGVAKVARLDEIWDHAKRPLPGGARIANLFTVQGVKYTTFRALAARTADAVAKRLGDFRPSRTAGDSLVGCPESSYYAFKKQLATAVPENGRLEYLATNYGALSFDILKIEAHEEVLKRPLAGLSEQGSGTVRASDVIYSIRKEMAQSLADILLRRTAIGAIGGPDRATIEDVSQLMTAELGWSEAKRREQVEEVHGFFNARRGGLESPPLPRERAAATPSGKATA